MTLGALVGTFVLNIGTGAGGFLPFAHQSAIPSWFVVVFLLFALVQLFGVNSLDMYSSGVTLQAIGVPVKRYQAVLDRLRHRPRRHHVGHLQRLVHRVPVGLRRRRHRVDRAVVRHLPGRLVLRRYRYVPSELQKTGRDSLYWRRAASTGRPGRPSWSGMFAAVSALYVNPTYYFRCPPGSTRSRTTPDAAGYGADFSVFLGMGVAALVYLALAWGRVRREARTQDALLREEHLSAHLTAGTAPASPSPPPGPRAVGAEQRHGPERVDQAGVLAQCAPPLRRLRSRACRWPRARPPCGAQAQGRGQRGPGGDHVVDHRDPLAAHGVPRGPGRPAAAAACRW